MRSLVLRAIISRTAAPISRCSPTIPSAQHNSPRISPIPRPTICGPSSPTTPLSPATPIGGRPCDSVALGQPRRRRRPGHDPARHHGGDLVGRRLPHPVGAQPGLRDRGQCRNLPRHRHARDHHDARATSGSTMPIGTTVTPGVERFNSFLTGHYDVSDSLTLYTEIGYYRALDACRSSRRRSTSTRSSFRRAITGIRSVRRSSPTARSIPTASGPDQRARRRPAGAADHLSFRRYRPAICRRDQFRSRASWSGQRGNLGRLRFRQRLPLFRGRGDRPVRRDQHDEAAAEPRSVDARCLQPVQRRLQRDPGGRGLHAVVPSGDRCDHLQAQAPVEDHPGAGRLQVVQGRSAVAARRRSRSRARRRRAGARTQQDDRDPNLNGCDHLHGRGDRRGLAQQCRRGQPDAEHARARARSSPVSRSWPCRSSRPT